MYIKLEIQFHGLSEIDLQIFENKIKTILTQQLYPNVPLDKLLFFSDIMVETIEFSEKKEDNGIQTR